MFLGTTTSEQRLYMADALRKGGYRRIWEPFAGNFAFTQVAMSTAGGVPIVSGDVSLYSSAIGKALSGGYLDFQISKETNELFPFDENWDGFDRAAYIIMLLDIGESVDRAEKVLYHSKRVEKYRSNQRAFLDLNANRLKKIAAKIQNWTFRSEDAFKLLEEVESGDMVFYDPPYFTNGYEKMFAFLNKSVTWDEPKYTLIDDKLKRESIQGLLKKGAHVFYRPEDPVEIEGLNQVFNFRYQDTKTYSIYTNDPRAPIHTGWAKTMREEPGRLPMMEPETVLDGTENVELIEIPVKQLNHYRLMWTHKARMKDAANMGYALMINGKCAGVAGTKSGIMIGSDLAVIISDAVPVFKNQAKMSKLVLYLLLTEETLTRFNRKTLWNHSGYTTMVYTDAPASMKYRGLFELAKREDGNDGHKFKLTYSTRVMVAKTQKRAYRLWWEKYGKDKGTD